MYDEETNQPAKANNSNINEDLGQVEYLFSDKTGTLTENEMIFKQFFLNGIIYEFNGGNLYKLGSDEPEGVYEIKSEMRKFFEVLSLCHTVQVDVNAKEKYQASSPDEFSFIKFCETMGISFIGDFRQSVDMIRKIDFLGEKRNYEILYTLEFDSNRKRMSVIIKCFQTGQVILFSKGAEDSILPKCLDDITDCNESISKFARQGWRTMALAYKFLSKKEIDFYAELLKEAYNDLSDKREDTLSQLYETIESDLSLIGSTAVEDRLQDGVASTLQELRKAGIKIWVLTGDKKETALNISHSCKHFSSKMFKLILTDLSDINTILNRLRTDLNYIQKFKDKKTFAYVVDGKTLGYIFKFEFNEIFRDVCMRCDAVLCCRMSPSQKAQVDFYVIKP